MDQENLKIKDKKGVSLIVIIILIVVAVIITTVVLVIKNNSQKSNLPNQEANNNIQTNHNKLLLINSNSSNASKSKLAFIYTYHNIGNTVITVDYNNLLNQSIDISGTEIKNDLMQISKYRKDYMELDINIENINYIIEWEASPSNNREILKNNRWVLKEGNIDNAYELYYVFNSSSNDCLCFNIFDSSLEDAKELMNNAMKIFNIYYLANEDDFINAKDVNGNIVSLKDYNFFNDVIIQKLNKEGLTLASSLYITNYQHNALEIEIPYLEETISYKLKAEYGKYIGSYEIENTFDLNGATIQMIQAYGDGSKNFYITTNGKYYAINEELPYDFEDKTKENHQKLFIENFN